MPIIPVLRRLKGNRGSLQTGQNAAAIVALQATAAQPPPPPAPAPAAGGGPSAEGCTCSTCNPAWDIESGQPRPAVDAADGNHYPACIAWAGQPAPTPCWCTALRPGWRRVRWTPATRRLCRSPPWTRPAAARVVATVDGRIRVARAVLNRFGMERGLESSHYTKPPLVAPLSCQA